MDPRLMDDANNLDLLVELLNHLLAHPPRRPLPPLVAPVEPCDPRRARAASAAYPPIDKSKREYV